jgi:hypothetical protein
METQHADNSKIFTSIDDIINYYTLAGNKRKSKKRFGRAKK